MDSETQPWDNDLLNRRIDAEYLYQLIKTRSKRNAKSGSTVINVDAQWGQGKTYFIENMYLDVLSRGHPAITINAWKYDFVDDPYTYVMAELNSYFTKVIRTTSEPDTIKEKARIAIKAVQNNAGKLLWTGIKGAAKRASRIVVGEGVEEMVEIIDQYAPQAVASEAKAALTDAEKHIVQVTDEIITSYIKKRLDDFSETKESLEQFRNNLEKLIDLLGTDFGMQMPMFVFVDELDRCRPTYAIQMLERIKHLFDIPNLAFIVATDTTSLSHSIKAVYGEEFDSKQYLGRFFGRTYRLAKASRHNIIKNIISSTKFDIDKWSFPPTNLKLKSICEFIDMTSQYFGMSIRQTEQSMNLLFDITFANYERPPLELCYLYTLICEFISQGSLNGNDWRSLHIKIREFGSQWRLNSNQEETNYVSLISKIHEYSNLGSRQALEQAATEVRSNGGLFSTYLYERIRGEYESKSKTQGSRLDLAHYYEYINIAKNAYIDESIEEAKKTSDNR
ncbi:KAP family P-loop NTPase fold protein [Agrobacterium tumefaciens]|uniref:KAP NTPase domain-containing protein n=1 Tax=Agrobacterium tumefaciens TaxID=358 RepID=A0AA44F7X3_AGRTU|nr:P-loop NTPase fold protein [Agrobacterium tumefaciens]NTB86835.1 hypothetical protein [Agrobacterium tumefaciens]NTC21164.1 hypothetical protein [Agrobacterium tumefaciens]NTC30712.1 hypothetical protein [Agrobacterium tumefaciens]